MELKEDIMQIIARMLNHEASAEDSIALEAWLREDPVHQQEYEAYAKIWEESSKVVIQHDFGTGSAWQIFEKKIKPADTVRAQKSKIFTMKRLLAAATVIIFITAGIIYFVNYDTRSWKSLVTKTTNRKFTLPDGSTVLLRKESTLRYPADYGKENRLSELNGEAIFEVIHDAERPFKVSGKGALVEVIGTTFLLRNDADMDEVVVVSGKVRFAEKKDHSNEVLLMQGQKAELKNNKIIQDSVANSNYMSWQSGKLSFFNTPFSRVMHDISHHYQVEIIISPEVLSETRDIQINAEFENETLDQVISEIQLTTGLKISRKDGVLIVLH